MWAENTDDYDDVYAGQCNDDGEDDSDAIEPAEAALQVACDQLGVSLQMIVTMCMLDNATMDDSEAIAPVEAACQVAWDRLWVSQQ